MDRKVTKTSLNTRRPLTFPYPFARMRRQFVGAAGLTEYRYPCFCPVFPRRRKRILYSTRPPRSAVDVVLRLTHASRIRKRHLDGSDHVGRGRPK
ncbi:hypothetical protein A0H81_12443 [Grifola frondosa]|uniref:Uncharacterized protein n=1 Tax=Grifola frondosa TaxID=5627 RepID=A0A1C7LS53_GRIFR|nr:hypothetical protein A0H81_12443 [Grifola frondosa]